MKIEHEDMADKLLFGRRELPSGNLHWHENIELCHMITGTADFTVGNHVYSFCAGDIITVPSRELHLYNSFNYSCVNICLIPVRELTYWMHNLPFLPPHISHAQIQSVPGLEEQLTHTFNRLYEEFTACQPYYSELVLMQTLSLWCLLARYFRSDTVSSTRHRQLLQPILDQISHDCSQPFSLTLLARQLNYTPEYLSSLFHKCVGMGFKEYLDNQRINEAKRMMLSSNASIAEIAQHCGYENIRTFNYRFKALVNMTPSEFISQFISTSK